MKSESGSYEAQVGYISPEPSPKLRVIDLLTALSKDPKPCVNRLYP